MTQHLAIPGAANHTPARDPSTSATTDTPAGRALRNLPPVCVVAFAPSSTRPGTSHILTRAYIHGVEVWGCSCESGRFRPDRQCRHVAALFEAHDRGGAELTPEGHIALGTSIAFPSA
jgi:hypothetical protein